MADHAVQLFPVTWRRKQNLRLGIQSVNAFQIQVMRSYSIRSFKHTRIKQFALQYTVDQANDLCLLRLAFIE